MDFFLLIVAAKSVVSKNLSQQCLRQLFILACLRITRKTPILGLSPGISEL